MEYLSQMATFENSSFFIKLYIDTTFNVGIFSLVPTHVAFQGINYRPKHRANSFTTLVCN